LYPNHYENLISDKSYVMVFFVELATKANSREGSSLKFVKDAGFLFSLVFALGAGSAFGALVPCPTVTTLATYDAPNYTCEVGTDVFSQFSYLSSATGGALAIPDTGITVATIGPAGSGADILGPNIGLDFIAAWNVLPGQTLDSNIVGVISVLPGIPMAITDAGEAQLSGGVSPNGSIIVTEQGCPNPPCKTTTWSQLTFNNGSLTSQLASDLMITATGVEKFAKDIALSGGTIGVGGLSSVEDTWSHSPVPEPMTLLLLGSGLFAFGLWKRRKTSKP
jgi:hypothetical protein